MSTREAIAAEMLALELSLLHDDFSADTEALEQMLGEDFREISPFGTVTARPEVIKWILDKDPASRWSLADFHVEVLGNDARLLTYHAARTGPLASGSKGARHCSLWRFNSAQQCWQLAFHQSTKVC
jgi:hypothetical protein